MNINRDRVRCVHRGAIVGLLLLSGCNGSNGAGAPGAIAPGISTTALPIADQTLSYSAALSATGTPDIRWALAAGSLPPGLRFSEAGTIEGIPTEPGSRLITVAATNNAGNDSRTLTLTVRPKTTAISAGHSSTKSDGPSGIYPTYGGESALSGDGRFVVFQSNAGNLVPNDTNAKRDVFLHDRHTGDIVRVSVATNGGEGNDASVVGTISGNGRIIAYHSFASNLVSNDTNAGAPGGGGGDIFVHDRVSHETTRVSVASLSGVEGTCATPPAAGFPCTSFDPGLDAEGQRVVFGSTFTNLVPNDTNGVADIFLHDRISGVTERVSLGLGGSEANGGSGNPGISADGRYVVFESTASNLVGPGNDANGASDIFVHDRATGITVLVSKNAAGTPGNWNSLTPSISRDGKWVAFWSVADNLVPNDTNGFADIFVVDWQSPAPTMRRISISGTGVEGNGDSRVPVMNGDGRYVVFESEASTLLDGGGDTNGATDVFVVDLQTGVLKRASVSGTGAEAVGGHSHTPSVSADGRFVSFTSEANNLEDGDTNGKADVFVTQRP